LQNLSSKKLENYILGKRIEAKEHKIEKPAPAESRLVETWGLDV
jgi:hypothetical protein